MATGQKLAGVDVLVKIGDPAVAVGGQSSCEISRSLNMIETTDKTNNGWVTKVGGTREWSIEMDAFLVIGDEGFKQLNKAFHERKPVIVECELAGIKFTGEALISSFPISAPLDDAVSFSISLEGSGELLETEVVQEVAPEETPEETPAV